MIRLPRARIVTGEARTDTPPAEQGADVVSRRVLVVDDNVDAAASLSLLLRIKGHEVETAHDGLEGLRIAERFRPDVALVDLGMPRMDGWELAARLRALQHGPAIMLVALTGWGSLEDQRRTRAAGFDRHLTKPVDPDAITALLAIVPERPASH